MVISHFMLQWAADMCLHRIFHGPMNSLPYRWVIAGLHLWLHCLLEPVELTDSCSWLQAALKASECCVKNVCLSAPSRWFDRFVKKKMPNHLKSVQKANMRETLPAWMQCIKSSHKQVVLYKSYQTRKIDMHLDTPEGIFLPSKWG